MEASNLLQEAKELIAKGEMDVNDLRELLELIDTIEEAESVAGHKNWFVPGTEYGIENLIKHKAAMAATKDYREVLVLGGNRSGKTFLGCFINSIMLTGDYPTWWPGLRFDGPVQTWAVGKTAQTTRDTLQRTLLGPVGAFGTGMIPKECIGKHVMSPVPGAVDNIMIKHLPTGKWSELGFKAYKQDTPSFFGTRKHFIHLDEPCPELIYNECVIRTVFPKGEVQGCVIHTITPKEGLTRLIADLLSTSDMLAGSEGLPNLKLAMALMKAEEADNDNTGG